MMLFTQLLEELAIAVFPQVNLLPVDYQVGGFRLLLGSGEGLAGQEQCQGQDGQGNSEMKVVIKSENGLTSYRLELSGADAWRAERKAFASATGK
jgi:hypothetical protein